MHRKKEHKRRAFFSRQFVKEERRRSYNWALILFGSVIMTCIVQQNVISPGIVTDKSMLPTLKSGEYYLINKYIYHFRKPRRGEIVVLMPYKNSTDEYVKRVVALEGETLQIRMGRVYINGQPITERYALGNTTPNLGPMQIPKGAYFVMGDNRNNSWDSRNFGSVSLEDIDGTIHPGELFPFN